MKTLTKTLRVFALTFIIILAAAGAGMMGVFLPNAREKYMDREIKIERIDRAKENKNEEDDQQKKS